MRAASLAASVAVVAVVRFCDLGAPAQADCRAAGYTGCAEAEQGGRTVAYCTP